MDLTRKFSLVEERIIDMDITFKLLTRVLWKVGKLISLTLLFMSFFVASFVVREMNPQYNGFSIYSIIGLVISALFLIDIVRLLMKEP